MPSQKIKPCPKCKTDSEVRIEVGHSPFTPHTLVRFHCEKCGFAGDAKKSLPEAVAAWNRRADAQKTGEVEQ